MEKLNVICVDDQREVLSAVRQDLEPLATWLNIEDCESAQEALELIEELDAEGECIALIVSDHVMPAKTGVEFLREIEDDTRFEYTKKILLTGQATHGDTINAINQAGIDRYFEKPWDAQTLVASARTLVSEFIFQMGLDYSEFQDELDPQVIFKFLR